jgi:SAM-dependent methyltransferase
MDDLVRSDVGSEAGSDAKCLLCGGAATGPAFPYGTRWEGREFLYWRCGRCASAFLHPVPGDAEIERMYARSAYHDTFYEEVIEESPISLLPRLRSQLKPGGRLLDFGCGNGSFMRAASRQGFECEGVELEENAREQAAKNSGCPVRALAEVKASGRRFDIIYMGDVLEHLPAPAAMLRELEPLLAPDGIFFIEGPIEDNASFVYYAARLFGHAKKRLGRPLLADYPPFHMFRTTAASQRGFFEKQMDYDVRAFLTQETGFPYFVEGDRLLRPRSAGQFIKTLIGRLSMGAAAAGRPLGAQLGNRFAALVRPRGA